MCLHNYLRETNISKKFDKYKKIRNKINYYGKETHFETVKKAREEIPKIIEMLEEHL